MRVKARPLLIASLLVAILIILSGFIVLRDYLARGEVKTVYIMVTETLHSFLTETTTVKTVLTERATVTVTSTVTIMTTAWKTGEGASCILLRPSKDVYGRSEPVAIRLVNNCGFDIILPNSAPWLIIDSSGRVVFSPIASQVIVTLRPGESKEWVWDQRDNEGRQVPPGTYTIMLMTANCGTLSTTFSIE